MVDEERGSGGFLGRIGFDLACISWFAGQKSSVKENNHERK
jgi:hypothetical protein